MNKILIVDDDKDLVEILEIFLNKLNFETISAFDGDSALELYKKEKPDLLILDIGIPGKMDGYAICNKIKLEKDIPIIMLTGYGAWVEPPKDCKPPNVYLTKPTLLKELIVIIHNLLNGNNC